MGLPAARARVLAAFEVVLAAAVVLLDLAIPSAVLVLLAGLSLAVRRERPATLGFHRLARPWRTTGIVVVLTLAWTLVQFGIVEAVDGQRHPCARVTAPGRHGLERGDQLLDRLGHRGGNR